MTSVAVTVSVGNLVQLGWNYVTHEMFKRCREKRDLFMRLLIKLHLHVRLQIFVFFKKEESLDASVTEKF